MIGNKTVVYVFVLPVIHGFQIASIVFNKLSVNKLYLGYELDF